MKLIIKTYVSALFDISYLMDKTKWQIYIPIQKIFIIDIYAYYDTL